MTPTQDTSGQMVECSALFGDWVPCSKAFPEDQVSVLAVSKHGKKRVLYRERGVWVEGLTTARWTPTHWTPLPPSPNVKVQRAAQPLRCNDLLGSDQAASDPTTATGSTP
jgi:hypothetical protein